MSNTTNTLVKGVAVIVSLGAVALLVRNIVSSVRRRKYRQKAFEEAKREANKPKELQQQADTYNPSSDVNKMAGYILGANMFNYPDEIADIIMPKSRARLVKLNSAWKKKTGESIYESLIDEWDGDDDYKSSLNKLKKHGIT